MNFKVLSVAALLIGSVCLSGASVAEKMPEKTLGKTGEIMPETPQQKEERIEANLTFLFKEAINASAAELENDHKMAPFAMLMKKDGTLGFFSTGDKNKGMSVNQQVASIRALLIDMASSQQIDATVQVMYASVSNKAGNSSQGLVFEIEHREGVSLMRFIPVSEIKDDAGKKTGKLLFEMEKLSTGSKPQTVFVASIVQ